MSVDSEREGSGDVKFADVTARCAALGGTYCATVHKNCAFLFATQGAVGRKTQRVRRAIKCKVPIVNLEYLSACESTGLRPETADFELSVEIVEMTSGANEKSATQRPDIDSNAYWAGSTHYDGGCSCACHDDGKASCEWCEAQHATGE